MFRMRIFYISLVNVILVGVKPLVRYAAKWKSQNSPKPAFLIKDEIIVTRDMVWKLGELQSVYNELQFNVETASPCTNLLKFC